MRMLAERAGVSAQAVSLALRNHPGVAASTRHRIHQIAREAGYRPDPHVARLMHHLRTGRVRRDRANVCALTTRPPGEPEVFCDLLRDGARAAAELAGFALQIVHVDRAAGAGARLQRVLRSRGIEGVILLPMARPCALDELLDWREFAVVSATLSVTSPRFDCVAANHFQNISALCERVRQAGYRRPGLVIRPKHDERCGHNITAAHAWHGIYGGLGLVRAHFCERVDRAALKRWLAEEKPDVLFAEKDELARELLQERALIGQRPIVTCSARPLANGRFPFPGNCDRPDRIGAVAVERLTHMITIGRRGIPAEPYTTVISGSWVGGAIPHRMTRRAPNVTAARAGS